MGILRSASCTYTMPSVVRKKASVYTARLALFSLLACGSNIKDSTDCGAGIQLAAGWSQCLPCLPLLYATSAEMRRCCAGCAEGASGNGRKCKHDIWQLLRFTSISESSRVACLLHGAADRRGQRGRDVGKDEDGGAVAQLQLRDHIRSLQHKIYLCNYAYLYTCTTSAP